MNTQEIWAQPSPPSSPAPSLPAHALLAPALPLEMAPALSSVPILAVDWSSGSDEEGEGGLAEEWSLASGDESEAIPAVDDVVKNWSSASQGSGSGSSNSQMVASQSCITLDAQSDHC